MTNNSEYASIEHSKKLAHLFPDAEWWWSKLKPELVQFGNVNQAHYTDWEIRRNVTYGNEDFLFYPAITIQMALDVLPKLIGNCLLEIKYFLNNDSEKMVNINYNVYIDPTLHVLFEHIGRPDELLSLLCKMIEYLEKEGLL